MVGLPKRTMLFVCCAALRSSLVLISHVLFNCFPLYEPALEPVASPASSGTVHCATYSCMVMVPSATAWSLKVVFGYFGAASSAGFATAAFVGAIVKAFAARLRLDAAVISAASVA